MGTDRQHLATPILRLKMKHEVLSEREHIPLLIANRKLAERYCLPIYIRATSVRQTCHWNIFILKYKWRHDKTIKLLLTCWAKLMAQLDSMPVEREYSCREVVKLEYEEMKIQLIKGILKNVFQQTNVWRSWKLVEKARKG